MEWGITDALSVKTEGSRHVLQRVRVARKIWKQRRSGDFVNLNDAIVFRLGVNWRLLPFGGAPISSGGLTAVNASLLFLSMAGLDPPCSLCLEHPLDGRLGGDGSNCSRPQPLAKAQIPRGHDEQGKQGRGDKTSQDHDRGGEHDLLT
jgi:hypothetical protein